MNVIIYHNADLDGKCSAAIAANRLRSDNKEYSFVGVNYGYNVPWDVIDEYSTVYVLDFSWPIELMREIQNRCKQLVWIDHHITAIEDSNAQSFDPPGYRSIARAACELCWDFFHPGTLIPKAVHYLGLYDNWAWVDHEDSNDILAFQYAMRLKGWWPQEEEDWDGILCANHEEFKSLIHDGHVILKYQSTLMERIVSFGHDLKIGDNLFFCCNTHHAASTDYDTLDQSKYAGVLSYRRKADGIWNYSIRAFGDTDVSEIAKAFGGGGHTGAGGWNGPLLEVLRG